MSWNRSLFLQFLSKRRSLVFGVYHFLNRLNLLRFGNKTPHRVYDTQTTVRTTRTFEDVFPIFLQHPDGYRDFDDFG
jgi:hypothetical protein